MVPTTERLLVTGGSGFIGTNLIDTCAGGGSSMLNFDLQPPKLPAHSVYWRKGDLLDKGAIAKAIADFEPGVIVHLGARTDLDEKSDLNGYSVNFEGTDNLIRAATECPQVQRIVFASSMYVTGPGHVPRNDADYSPHTLYGQSKVLMERRIRAAGELPFSWCILRPPPVWGPWLGQHYQRFFQLVEQGRYFHIGRNRVMRTLGFVGNVVRHIMAAATAPSAMIQGKVFYVGDDGPTALRDWAEEIRTQLDAPRIRSIPYPVARIAAIAGDGLTRIGIPCPIYSFRLRNLVTDWVLPVQPMVDLARPSPFTLADGVAATIAWMRAEKRLT